MEPWLVLLELCSSHILNQSINVAPFPTVGSVSCSHSSGKGWLLHTTPALACALVEDCGVAGAGFPHCPSLQCVIISTRRTEDK